jgi:hypothetical protein
VIRSVAREFTEAQSSRITPGYLGAAIDAGADAILLTSFNEWPGTTVVEPSSS